MSFLSIDKQREAWSAEVSIFMARRAVQCSASGLVPGAAATTLRRLIDLMKEGQSARGVVGEDASTISYLNPEQAAQLIAYRAQGNDEGAMSLIKEGRSLRGQDGEDASAIVYLSPEQAAQVEAYRAQGNAEGAMSLIKGGRSLRGQDGGRVTAAKSSTGVKGGNGRGKVCGGCNERTPGNACKKCAHCGASFADFPKSAIAKRVEASRKKAKVMAKAKVKA